MTKELTHTEKIQALTDKIDELLLLPKYVNAGGVDILIHHGTRQIMATDILRALVKTFVNLPKRLSPYNDMFIGEDGFYVTTGLEYISIDCICDFNTYTSLHEQSESTVADLYKLFFE